LQGTLGEARIDCVQTSIQTTAPESIPFLVETIEQSDRWSSKRTMSDPSTKNTSSTVQIPEELSIEIRRLAHDLSNALEIIVQTSYLLGMAELKEPASDWLRMLDSGVAKALELNLQLREYVKGHTQQ
jgi:hypothetical protein